MVYAICAIIKDEHPYLKEWLDYHFNLGFNQIYLYEDYNSKSHKSITDNYKNVFLSNLEQFEIENSANTKKQSELYNKFLKVHKELNDIDWCAFIDIDEYIDLTDGYTLNKLTDEYRGYAGVYLSWKMYGANGYVERPKGGIVESYTKECPKCDDSNKWNFKSFVNIHKAL